MDKKESFLTNKLLKTSDKKIKSWLDFVIIINEILTFLFVAFAMGIAYFIYKIVNATDMQANLLFVDITIIVILVICIIFLQSIVRIIIREIFEKRKEFNVSVRLIGGTKKELFDTYMSEFISTIKKLFPTGIALGIIIYLSLSTMLHFVAHTLLTLLITICISIFFVLLSYYLSIHVTLNNLVNFDLAGAVRPKNDTKKIYIIIKKIAKNALTLFFILSFISIRTSKSLTFTNKYALQFYWNGFFLMYIFFKYNKYIFIFINFIGNKLKFSPIIISSKMILHNIPSIKKVMAYISIGIILGNSFSMFFSAVRDSRIDLLNNNKALNEYFAYDEYVHKYYSLFDATYVYDLDGNTTNNEIDQSQSLSNFEEEHSKEKTEQNLIHKTKILTFIFDTPAFFIIFIGILSFLTWFVLNRSRIELEIAKIRALGATRNEIKMIGITFTAIIALLTMFISLIVSYFIANGHYYLFSASMAEIIVPIKVAFIPIISIIVIICIIIYLALLGLIKDLNQDKFVSRLREES